MLSPLHISTEGRLVRVQRGSLSRGAALPFRLRPQDQEDLRWYLEDYARFPSNPASAVASRIERQTVEWGQSLFAQVFGSAETRDVWNQAKAQLAETRIEITSTDPAIPWELMREEAAQPPLALLARSFVRTPSSRDAAPAMAGGEGLRVLVVICRPAGTKDVPYRAVASRVVKMVAGRCDVLRPPTLERLEEVLSAARAAGRPYDIVHFDGHGLFADLKAAALQVPPDPRSMRGYLVFETADGDQQYVNGTTFGQILREHQTPVLVLNACRSGRAAAASAPGEGATTPPGPAFTSLAGEVMGCGLSGVLAMRFNVFVDTAAEAMESFYDALGTGRSLGEAVTEARRRLAGNRAQHWYVLEVHEREVWAKTPVPVPSPGIAALESLPSPAEVGFVGRDIALLQLDRAFSTKSIVLLHGHIGGGKTAVASEFARWYSLTGGTAGPVVFTSIPLAVPKELPPLLICDGLDKLDKRYRAEMMAVLYAARSAGKKLLITSRAPEDDWLNDDVVYRILLGPVIPSDCEEIIERMCASRGATSSCEVLTPLIRFSFGNPLVLSGLLDDAISAGIKTRPDCERFVESLRSGHRQALKGLSPVLEAVRQFSADEQKQLAALAVFQEFVGAKAFNAVTGGGAELLERAVAGGLLAAMGSGYYAIHPGIWAIGGEDSQIGAFIEAYVSVGKTFINEMGRGNNAVLQTYFLEQANVWQAIRLARLRGIGKAKSKLPRGCSPTCSTLIATPSLQNLLPISSRWSWARRATKNISRRCGSTRRPLPRCKGISKQRRSCWSAPSKLLGLCYPPRRLNSKISAMSNSIWSRESLWRFTGAPRSAMRVTTLIVWEITWRLKNITSDSG